MKRFFLFSFMLKFLNIWNHAQLHVIYFKYAAFYMLNISLLVAIFYTLYILNTQSLPALRLRPSSLPSPASSATVSSSISLSGNSCILALDFYLLLWLCRVVVRWNAHRLLQYCSNNSLQVSYFYTCLPLTMTILEFLEFPMSYTSMSLHATDMDSFVFFVHGTLSSSNMYSCKPDAFHLIVYKTDSASNLFLSCNCSSSKSPML